MRIELKSYSKLLISIFHFQVWFKNRRAKARKRQRNESSDGSPTDDGNEDESDRRNKKKIKEEATIISEL